MVEKFTATSTRAQSQTDIHSRARVRATQNVHVATYSMSWHNKRRALEARGTRIESYGVHNMCDLCDIV
jgi:hypothetical protein